MKALYKFGNKLKSCWLKLCATHSSRPVHYFVHIPKTAGTSFIVLLDRYFPVNSIYPQQLWREAKHIDLVENQQYDLFRGHFGGGGAEVLTNRSIEYLTILRSPISLAVSTYQFVLRETNTKVHQIVKDNEMSFQSFLTHPDTAPLVQNRMVRNISFDFKHDPAAQEVFLSADTIDYLKSVVNTGAKELTDEQRLIRAKSFIKKSKWFALVERFDESLQLLCFVMNWPPIGPTQKLNAHGNQLQLSDKEKALLLQVNQQDEALYAFASDVFEQRYNHMNTVLQQFRTSAEQTTDDLLDLNYQEHRSKQNHEGNQFRYTFDQALFGTQWHRRELMQPEKEYFRWTGPAAEAAIDFWLIQRDYEITIRIINATSLELLDNVIITANGQKLQWHTQDEGHVRILNMQCPAQLIAANGLLRLSFKCNVMRSHQQVFGSDDERLVGLAMHWIQFDYAK